MSQISNPIMSNPIMSNTIVSFDAESLILVDAHDRDVGYKDKLTCHLGKGLLHRAFSLFIFNSNGELLIQQRSPQKKLWPLYWSNSCCSHPIYGETIENAIERRLQQELGFTTQLQYLYKFQYQVAYLNIGSEHELCSVFIGHHDAASLTVNRNEIADWQFISIQNLTKMMARYQDQITPWFK